VSARRFEFEDTTSSKFWAIERDAADVTVTFGRIGATGQRKTKSFPSEEKAAHEEEKLIAEKLGKGYREVTGTASDTPVARRASDGPDLFFADSFGLTRVTADGKIRTVTKLWGTALSLDADARFGVLHKPNGIRLIVNLARLTEVGALDDGEQMHPTGAVLTRVGTPYAFRVVLPNQGSGSADGWMRGLEVENAPERDPLRLRGGNSIDLSSGESLALDVSGNYISWFNYETTSGSYVRKRSVLCAGRFPEADGPATATWRVELRGPERGRLSVSIADGIPAVCLCDPATPKVDVAIFGIDDDAGAPVRVRTIDSATLPARVGQTLVYQPDAATVVSEPLEGGAAARYQLAEKHRGLGRVIARGDRWLFVPAHGESVLDLAHGGGELDRGLPAAGAKARAEASAQIAKIRELVSDAGMEAEMEVATVGKRTSAQVRLSGGPAFLGRALENAIAGYLEAAGVGAPSAFSLSHSFHFPGRVTRAEMIDLLRYFDAHKAKLDWTGSFVDCLHPFPDGMFEPVEVDPDAEALLLWAALDEIAPADGGDFEVKLAAWTKGAPPPPLIAERLSAAAAQIGTVWHTRLWNVIAGITVRRFRGDALDIWFALPERYVCIPGAVKALAWLAAEDSGARQRLATWFASLKEAGILREILEAAQ
jgi:predicted DNA-binding WGR domain protein